MMEQDALAGMFRFRLGEIVQYAEYPTEKHYIRQRRWTQREILAPVVEYRLALSQTRGSPLGWVSEHDLAPWHDSD